MPSSSPLAAYAARFLATAMNHNEPAGQLAARELEIVRIKQALQRSEELSADVASAIEAHG